MEDAKPAQSASTAILQPPPVSPPTQSTNTLSIHPDGIRAEVKAKVKVRGDGYLQIHLYVVAINLTGANIELKDPYEVRVKNAKPPKASAYIEMIDSKSDVFLGADATDSIRVRFKKQSAWKDKEKLHIEVTFEAEGLFEVEGELLFGPYSIKPVYEYQGIPITNHKFEYTFAFNTPKPSGWEEYLAWPFKVNEVLQSNSRKITASKLRLPWHTTLKYSFDAAKDQDLKITFAREYKFWSVLSAAALFVLGCVIEFVAHDYVMDVLGKIKNYLGKP